jgi:hypothetical protein
VSTDISTTLAPTTLSISQKLAALLAKLTKATTTTVIPVK